MDVAESVARHLVATGVSRVYGFPGEDHMRLLDAIVGAGLQYVPAKSETAACMMAGADAQLTGTPGIVLVTLAPGITNAINGIANALLDRIPLIVISGQHAPDRYPTVVRQSLDNHMVVNGVVKWSVTAGTRIHQTLAKALDTALTAPAGPVYLEIRDDVATAEATDQQESWARLRSAQESDADAGEHVIVHAQTGPLAEVRARLHAARRPALLIGGQNYKALERIAIAEFADSVCCPVFTTPVAKGTLSPTSDWAAGTFYNGNLERRLLDQCDLLFTLNLDAHDILNRTWPYRAYSVAINRTHSISQQFLPVAHELSGDLRAILEEVTREADETPGPVSSAWTHDDVADYRSFVEQSFQPPAPRPDGRMSVVEAIIYLRTAMPKDTLVTVDAGFGKPLASMLWPSESPRSYFASHGLSTMGYAIPSANALKLIDPSRPVIALLGDGSLLMSATEIAAASELGIAPIYVAWMDDALLQIRLKQERQGFKSTGTSIGRRSCAAIAAAFGGHGVDVETRAELAEAVGLALESEVPTLIGIRVDHSPAGNWFEILRG